MPIANGLALPNPLSNGTTEDAVPVMGDFNYLLGALNRALLDQGGTAGMNAQNTQIHNLANGAASGDAINLSQLAGYAPLASPAFTGTATFAALTASGPITGNGGFSGTTLNVTGAASFGSNVSTTGELVTNEAGGTGVVRFGGPAGSGTHYLFFDGTKFILTDLLSLGALTATGALNFSGALTTGSAANSIGYLGAPQNLQTASYTLALSDIGKSVDMNVASGTLTIPANASVAFPVDTVIIGSNLNASSLTIAITTDTLTMSGTTTTGPRTIGQNGEFRLIKKTATSWLISGTAMS